MDLPDWIDGDVIYHPVYWMLTFGTEVALLFGFKTQTLWGVQTGASHIADLLTKIGILALVPVASYFVFRKFQS